MVIVNKMSSSKSPIKMDLLILGETNNQKRKRNKNSIGHIKAKGKQMYRYYLSIIDKDFQHF